MKHSTIIAGVLLIAPPVLGHHSDAGLDMESVITLEGTVTGYYFRNPHVYFTLEADDENGEAVEWTLQMGGTITTGRMGWTRDSLVNGDRITVEAHPELNGRPYGLVESVEKETGTISSYIDGYGNSNTALYESDVTASTTTLEGKWMANSSELVSYPGGFDGFFIANLELTERGGSARAAYDPLSPENPEATCVGRPTPAMLVSSNLYPIEITFNDDEEVIVIRTDYWDEVRTVYMDGRGHPDGNERFQTGYSIGFWDGGTLVVDTRNFSDHRSPYQIGVPSGGQKHVLERYSLIENGTRIAVEFILEDSEYIAEPLTHSRELIYSPHLQSSRFDCDPEATRRFMLPLN